MSSSQSDSVANVVLDLSIDRRGFERRVGGGGVGAIVVVDVMNVTAGAHLDELLPRVAERIVAVVRDVDAVTRIGREQLAVTPPDTRRSDVPRVAERPEEALGGEPVAAAGRQWVVYATAGWAMIDEAADDDSLGLALERTAVRVQERSRRGFQEAPLRDRAPQDVHTFDEFADIVIRSRAKGNGSSGI